MISIKAVKYLKQISELQVDLIPGGAIYLIIEGDKFVWRKASKVFDLDIFQVGEKLNANSISGRAIKENKTISRNVPRSLYGIRLRMIAEPIVNEEGQAIGAFSIVFPRLHPVAKSFGDFAPILAEMFPEGAFLYMTDLKKIAYRQPSRKFDVHNLQVKDIISEDLIASKVIKTKEPITMELDSSKYGMPVLVTCYPLFDEDNSEEVVATLGVVIPKVIAGNLRDMSHNLESGLEGIVSAIEQLSTSAYTIHENEQELNNEIEEIIGLSEQIDEVSTFIKKISDETNMLGLNAAIEAARAGESGMGFSVVAKQIRKLSEQSKNTVPKIRILTDSIKAKVGKTSDKSQSSLVSSQEQAATTEEITASVEEIAAMSEELSKIAQQM